MQVIKNINWPALIILVFYPIFLIFLGAKYAFNQTIGWFEIGLFVLGYYGSNISIGLGMHRLWSHNSYKASKLLEFVLIMLSAGTLQGPTLAWASDHHKHHNYTDKELDPHSPLKYKNKLLGFLWSHMGWMLIGEGSYKSIGRITMVKLGRNKLVLWQMKYYWQIATFMNSIMPFAVGYLLGGSIAAGYAGFLFIGLGRALQQQLTFCVNSVCHFLGKRQYYKGTAGDIWWLAPFLLGENWHNYHHAFPSDYRNGAKWYQADVHKWLIYICSKVGLASDLDRTQEVRVQAKIAETSSYVIEKRQEKFDFISIRISELTENLYDKMKLLEESSSNLKQSFIKSYKDIEETLNRLNASLQKSIKLTEKSSEKLLKTAYKKVANIEKSMQQIYQNISVQISSSNAQSIKY